MWIIEINVAGYRYTRELPTYRRPPPVPPTRGGQSDPAAGPRARRLISTGA